MSEVPAPPKVENTVIIFHLAISTPQSKPLFFQAGTNSAEDHDTFPDPKDVEPPQKQMLDVPDGGLEAWLVVLGVLSHISSSGRFELNLLYSVFESCNVNIRICCFMGSTCLIVDIEN